MLGFRFRGSALLSFLALWCAIGHAQAPVTLKVTVNDENGVAQRSARVSLQLAGSAALFKQETDFSGRCQFPSLPAGAYLLHVEKEGFYAVNETLQLSAATGAIEIELHHLQEVKEEVNVVEDRKSVV